MPKNSSLEPRLTRETLETLPKTALHTPRNSTKANVYFVEWNGQKIVVKDIRNRPIWTRFTVALWLLRREIKALAALETAGLRETPHLRGQGRDFFAARFCQGQQLKKFARGEVQSAVIERVEAALQRAHAAGIVHGDLHRENILVDENGQISILDWASASVFGQNKRRLWHEWLALDRRALAKIKARYAPQLLADEEKLILEQGGSPLYRKVREFGFRVRRALGNKKADSMQRSVKTYSKLANSAPESPTTPPESPTKNTGETPAS